MNNVTFQACQAPEPPRGYLKLQDMKHKDYIIAKHRAGVKQKDIIKALKEEKGFILPLYKLKRMLNKWGVNGQNLTKRRKQDIHAQIELRRQLGKQTHQVVLKRSGKSITNEQMNAIMNTSIGFPVGAGTTAGSGSPAFLALTPRVESLESEGNGTQGSGVSPRFPENMDTGNNSGGSLPANTVMGNDSGDDILENMDMESDSGDSLPEDMDTESDPGGGLLESGFLNAETMDGTGLETYNNGGMLENTAVTDCDSPQYLDDLDVESGDTTDWDEFPDSPEKVADIFINLGRRGTEATAVDDEDDMESINQSEYDDEELREIVSAGFSKLCPTETQPTPSLDDGVDVMPNEAQEDTSLSKYQPAPWSEIDDWKEEARDFVAEVEFLTEAQGIPLSQAIRTVISQWEETKAGETKVREPLPYHIYKQILGEGQETLVTTVDGVDKDLLRSTIEDNFVALERIAREAPTGSKFKYRFNAHAVHLPFLLSEYGVNHFFVAWALDLTADTLMETLSDGAWANLFNNCAFLIYESISMGTHTLAMDVWALISPKTPSKVAIALNKARDKVRSTIIKKYRWDHMKTLYLHVRIANEMYYSRELQKGAGELMAYGLFKILVQIYTKFPISMKGKGWTLSQEIEILQCFGALGDILLGSGEYSNVVVKYLVEPSVWGKRSTYLHSVDPMASCMHVIGRAYAKIGKLKESLRELMACLEIYRHKGSFGLDHEYWVQQIDQITEVMSLRGPILYETLDSNFYKLPGLFEAARKARRRYQQELYQAGHREMGDDHIDAEEYGRILARRASKRLATPELADMQTSMYFEGLECWLYSQGNISSASDRGWVEEI
ncbi:hypothetical protein TWF730_008095 [Orbilia blumenaviensis]|uniref:Clr5 domain-containing protein n=1 Tax=Orbilia blumenaviensis TaxID=1796055 RepID=A0AAV9VCY7_9PEZI